MSDIIGTLAEHTLHSAIKGYFEPDKTKHEVRFHGFIADIKNDDGITEIQTKQFVRLKRKLDVFLEECPVTVVYPIVVNKWIVWIDRETGEISPKRKSPQHGSMYDAVPEFYALRGMLNREGLSFKLIFCDAVEYRYALRGLNDRRKGMRQGHWRCELVPCSIGRTVDIVPPEGYRVFLPEGLPERFNSSDFASAAGISQGTACYALKLLTETETVLRVDRNKKGYVYILNN